MASVVGIILDAEVRNKTADLSTSNGLTSDLKTMVQEILQELSGGEFEVENTPRFEPGIFQASLKDFLRRLVELGRNGGDDLTGSESERHVAECVNGLTTVGPDIWHESSSRSRNRRIRHGNIGGSRWMVNSGGKGTSGNRN